MRIVKWKSEIQSYAQLTNITVQVDLAVVFRGSELFRQGTKYQKEMLWIPMKRRGLDRFAVGGRPLTPMFFNRRDEAAKPEQMLHQSF